jgi:hypothetical protein
MVDRSENQSIQALLRIQFFCNISTIRITKNPAELWQQKTSICFTNAHIEVRNYIGNAKILYINIQQQCENFVDCLYRQCKDPLHQHSAPNVRIFIVLAKSICPPQHIAERAHKFWSNFWLMRYPIPPQSSNAFIRVRVTPFSDN